MSGSFKKLSFAQMVSKIIFVDCDAINVIIGDKIQVQEYVEDRVGKGELFNQRLYSGYDIDEALTYIDPPCIIKMNNAWRRMLFIDNNPEQDTRKNIYNKLKFWMGSIVPSWEWYYQKMIPGVVVEKTISHQHDLMKIFVFGGRVKYIWAQRYDNTSMHVNMIGSNVYDEKFTPLNIGWNKTPILAFSKPKRLNDLIEYSEKIAVVDTAKIPAFCRVDLYYHEDKIYFSEMTYGHAGGTQGFNPPEFDFVLAVEIKKIMKEDV